MGTAKIKTNEDRLLEEFDTLRREYALKEHNLKHEYVTKFQETLDKIADLRKTRRVDINDLLTSHR